MSQLGAIHISIRDCLSPGHCPHHGRRLDGMLEHVSECVEHIIHLTLEFVVYLPLWMTHIW